MSDDYSPQLFVESSQTVVQKLANVVPNISAFTHSMITLADYINSAIVTVNSKSDDDSSEFKREMRNCRDNYLKTKSSSSTFIDRFNKLLRYADIDEEWESEMKEATVRGDLKSFSSYINQLNRYLDQCSESYQSFVSVLANAESHCVNAPIALGTNRRSSSNLESMSNSRGRGFIDNLPRFFLAIGASFIGGIGTLIFAKHEGVRNSISIGLGVCVAIFLYFVTGKALVGLLGEGREGEVAARKRQLTEGTFREFSQGYDAVRNTALKVDLSVQKVCDSLKALSSEAETRRVSSKSFNPALEMFLEEIRKARKIVEPCYEKLDKGIIIARVSF